MWLRQLHQITRTEITAWLTWSQQWQRYKPECASWYQLRCCTLERTCLTGPPVMQHRIAGGRFRVWGQLLHHWHKTDSAWSIPHARLHLCTGKPSEPYLPQVCSLELQLASRPAPIQPHAQPVQRSHQTHPDSQQDPAAQHKAALDKLISQPNQSPPNLLPDRGPQQRGSGPSSQPTQHTEASDRGHLRAESVPMSATRVVMHQIVLPGEVDTAGVCFGGQVNFRPYV